MQFKAAGAPGATHTTDAFILFRAEKAGDLRSLPVPDDHLRGLAAAAVKAGEFTGKAGETALFHGGRNGRRLLLAGLGKDPDADALRRAAANAAKLADRRKLETLTFLVPAKGDARAIVEGAGLGLYRFNECRSKKEKAHVRKATVAPEKGKAKGLKAAVAEGAAITEAVAFARDLGNLPGNLATPVYLAKRARELAGGQLTVKIHDRAAIKRMKMGAFAAVAQGSRNEPRLIEFRYRGASAKAPTLAFVGKGVTFDTGGISIKPSAKMEDMKFDMCGGAAVFGLMHLVAALQPSVNIHALVPSTDNMPDGAAYRPGDIVKARNGKTVEIISTDAEGRLLLCDALAYAAEKKPASLIDLATLTGACVVALADAAAGLFGSDDDLVERVRQAGLATGETAWPMPLFPRYTEMMKGVYADLKNGGGRWGGACTAAAFLKEFVGDVPWVHLDIAGVAWADGERGHNGRGATGYGVRLLWEFLGSKT